jgi:hypothetical protein
LLSKFGQNVGGILAQAYRVAEVDAAKMDLAEKAKK